MCSSRCWLIRNLEDEWMERFVFEKRYSLLNEQHCLRLSTWLPRNPVIWKKYSYKPLFWCWLFDFFFFCHFFPTKKESLGCFSYLRGNSKRTLHTYQTDKYIFFELELYQGLNRNSLQDLLTKTWSGFLQGTMGKALLTPCRTGNKI